MGAGFPLLDRVLGLLPHTTFTPPVIALAVRLGARLPFAEVSTLETHRRGTRAAATVVAVTDGAEWIQGWIDGQRADAVRVLDVAHAVEHLGNVAKAQFGAGTAAASEWLGVQAHALRHGREDQVLATLAALGTIPGEAGAVATATHQYLARRRELIRYADFVAAGYPIGSGCVESANKTVVDVRLKGAGMHWKRAHLPPMLDLRTMLRNARWDDRWPAIWAGMRQWGQRSARPAPGPVEPAPVETPAPQPPRRPPTIVNGKPTPDHPWRRCSPFPAKS